MRELGGDDVVSVIHRRRSISKLVEPAPTGEELELLLDAARAAPDHGKLQPWQFTILRGAEMEEVVKEKGKPARAPLIIAAACVTKPSETVPKIEQVCAVAAAVENILLVATELGYGSMWRTGAPARDPNVKSFLGLGEDDVIVAFVYLGTVPG